MPGRGPAPKTEGRRRANEPARGDWVTSEAVGWQHGDMPRPPAKMTRAARDAWFAWMESWVAAHWLPTDLPGLRQLIRLYDQVERGEFQRHAELRLAMDTYGLTPKGQQDRRWARPGWVLPAPAEADPEEAKAPLEEEDPYRHLRVVG